VFGSDHTEDAGSFYQHTTRNIVAWLRTDCPRRRRDRVPVAPLTATWVSPPSTNPTNHNSHRPKCTLEAVRQIEEHGDSEPQL